MGEKKQAKKPHHIKKSVTTSEEKKNKNKNNKNLKLPSLVKPRVT
jgi:hypothetical protein